VLRRAAFFCALALHPALAPAAFAAASDEVAFARATALARAGRCPEAVTLLAELSVPSAASVHLRARCQLEAKDWPAALASLEEAKRLDPAAPGLELQLAVARFHLGDYTGASEALDRAAPGAQDDPQYHLYRGLVLLQQARSDEAARELARARAISPGRVEPGASYYEGLAWAGAEDKEKAREALDRVIESAPGTPWALEAERAKADLDRLAGARGKLWAFARAGLEYDDNVRLLADDVFPTNNPNEDRSRDSHDVRGVLLLHGGAQLLEGRGWAAGVQGTYYASFHDDLEDFNEQYPVLGLWYDQRLADATSLRLSYDVGYAAYQGDSFLFTQTLRPSLFHDFGEVGRSELFASVYKYDYLYDVGNVRDAASSVPLDPCPVPDTAICGPPGLNEAHVRDRDGWGLAAGIEHRFPLDALDTELTGGVSYLRYSAQGSEYSYNGVGTWIGTETELPFEAAFRTSIGYSYLGYRNPSSYPDPSDPGLQVPTALYALAGVDRHDNRWYYAVELEKYLTDTISASLRYSYTNNNSNVAVFAYDREITGVYVTYRWQQ